MQATYAVTSSTTSRAVQQAVLLSALLSLSARSDAQPMPPQSLDCFQDVACRREHDRGRASAKSGRTDEAMVSYEQAYQRVADPMLLWKLARLLDQVGRTAESRAYYQKYLASGDPVRQSQAEQRIRQLSLLAPPPPPVAQLLPVQPTAKPAGSPLYRKWWLWTIAGVGASGLAIGFGLGIAAQRPDTSKAQVVLALSN